MRVLIAEDDVTSRLLLKRVLEGWGYEVIATTDGAEAWEALQAEDGPRLAILDGMMPQMDGVDVCRRLRAQETLQPPYLILLTALGDKESVVTGLDAGADDFVRKPYDPDELRARLAVGRRLVELNDELLGAQHALEILARTDALTGVLNRGAIVGELEQEAARAAREGSLLGLGMLDIDRFKFVNDTHGHAAGDAVLCEIVQRVLGVMRPYDAFGRVGGEEFLVIVPGCGEKELRDVLERIRRAISRTPIVAAGHEVAVTMSLGGAVRRRGSADRLIARADDALYTAKGAGPGPGRLGGGDGGGVMKGRPAMVFRAGVAVLAALALCAGVVALAGDRPAGAAAARSGAARLSAGVSTHYPCGNPILLKAFLQNGAGRGVKGVRVTFSFRLKSGMVRRAATTDAHGMARVTTAPNPDTAPEGVKVTVKARAVHRGATLRAATWFTPHYT